MIHITYSHEQKALAEQIRDDLSDSNQLSRPLLIVLVSAQSKADPLVQAEIERARGEHTQILPIQTENVSLPTLLQDRRRAEFQRGL